MHDGFAFCGSEVHRIHEITTVPALMAELTEEMTKA
jgi:hypothetical protein